MLFLRVSSLDSKSVNSWQFTNGVTIEDGVCYIPDRFESSVQQYDLTWRSGLIAVVN